MKKIIDKLEDPKYRKKFLPNKKKGGGSTYWERLKNDPVKMADYKERRRKKREREKAASESTAPTTIVPELRRKNMLSEIIDLVYSYDWGSDDLQYVFQIVKSAHRIASGKAIQ